MDTSWQKLKNKVQVRIKCVAVFSQVVIGSCLSVKSRLGFLCPSSRPLLADTTVFYGNVASLKTR